MAELKTADLPAFSQTLDDLRRIDGISATETNLLLSEAICDRSALLLLPLREKVSRSDG